ncbi:MAG: hypothetical protein V1870_04335 [Candidatus Aenigmatarchaeota archaeon]
MTKEDYLSTFKNYKLGLFSFNKYNKNFPILPSTTLSGIVADVTGDGYLGRGIIQYISKNKTEAIRFRNEINKIFPINGIIRRSPSNKVVWECLIGNNALVKVLKASGVPFGEKVLTKFDVPAWIVDGRKEYKKRYIQRLLDCEGTIVLQKSNRIRIKIKMHKSEELMEGHYHFLNQIRNMLSDFSIKTTNPSTAGFTKRKDGIITKGLEFEFYGTRKNLSSILNFRKHINFESEEKRVKLNTYLSILNNNP